VRFNPNLTRFPQEFSEAVREVHAVLAPLLLRHNGYNILPQREGSFMFSFHKPVDVARFFYPLTWAYEIRPIKIFQMLSFSR
jgi:hypothetical protein